MGSVCLFFPSTHCLPTSAAHRNTECGSSKTPIVQPPQARGVMQAARWPTTGITNVSRASTSRPKLIPRAMSRGVTAALRVDWDETLEEQTRETRDEEKNIERDDDEDISETSLVWDRNHPPLNQRSCDFPSPKPQKRVNMIHDEESGAMTVVGELDVLGLTPSEAYALLTDHANSHEIFSTILSCEMEEDAANGTILLTQNCKWSFLVFSGTFPVRLEVKEDPSARTFSFRDTATGGFLKSMHGSWTVGPSPSIPGGVRITHQLNALTALAAPPPFDKYTNKIFKSQVNEILEDLEKEITRRGYLEA